MSTHDTNTPSAERMTPITDDLRSLMRLLSKAGGIDPDVLGELLAETGRVESLERQLANSDNQFVQERIEKLSILGDLDCLKEKLAAAIRERNQARADATEWSLNLTTAIRELAEAREELRDWKDAAASAETPCADEVHCSCVPLLKASLAAEREKNRIIQDGLKNAAEALTREKALADQLKEACQWAQCELGKHTRPSLIDDAITAWKEARKQQNTTVEARLKAVASDECSQITNHHER